MHLLVIFFLMAKKKKKKGGEWGDEEIKEEICWGRLPFLGYIPYFVTYESVKLPHADSNSTTS